MPRTTSSNTLTGVLTVMGERATKSPAQTSSAAFSRKTRRKSDMTPRNSDPGRVAGRLARAGRAPCLRRRDDHRARRRGRDVFGQWAAEGAGPKPAPRTDDDQVGCFVHGDPRDRLGGIAAGDPPLFVPAIAAVRVSGLGPAHPHDPR